MTPAAGDPLPTRPFGRHPDRVSIIALGGGHLSRPTVTDQEAERVIRTALDNGVTFFDNSWDYGDGVSEHRFGQALANHRDDIFLMSKVCDRTRDGALRQLDESLRRLRTDYLDLWQFHEVNYDNDPEWIFEPGGAIEAAEAAKAQGKVRYVGFTGHKSPHIFKGMLAADYEWDACQMPVSVFDHQYRSFTADILPELKRRGIACIGMKSLGGSGQFVTEAGLTPQELRRYALSQPITSLACGAVSLSPTCCRTSRSPARSPRCPRKSSRPCAIGCGARPRTDDTSGSRHRRTSTRNTTQRHTGSAAT